MDGWIDFLTGGQKRRRRREGRGGGYLNALELELEDLEDSENLLGLGKGGWGEN